MSTFPNLPDNNSWQMPFTGDQMIPIGAFIQSALGKPFVLARLSRHTNFERVMSVGATLVPSVESSLARTHRPIRRWNNPALLSVRIHFDDVTRQLFLSEENQTQIEYIPMALNETGKRATMGVLTFRYRIEQDDRDSYAEMLFYW